LTGVGWLAKAWLLLYIDLSRSVSNYEGNYEGASARLLFTRFTSVPFYFEPHTNKRVRALEKR
jgi:hypothetical protein